MKQRIVIGSIGAVIAALTLGSAGIAAQFGGPPPTGAAAMKEAASRPTPKRPNGVPDFTGIWVQTRSRADNVRRRSTRRPAATRTFCRAGQATPSTSSATRASASESIPREARPWYKPQYWERVQFNDVHGHSAEGARS